MLTSVRICKTRLVLRSKRSTATDIKIELTRLAQTEQNPIQPADVCKYQVNLL